MNADEIRGLLKAKPFKPFTVHRPDARAVRVDDPKYAMVTQGGRFLFFCEEGDSFTRIDLTTVTHLEKEAA